VVFNDGVVGFKANACGAVGRGMELTRDLFWGCFNIVIGLAGNQDHTKAKAECHYKTKNRFFHHRKSFRYYKGGCSVLLYQNEVSLSILFYNFNRFFRGLEKNYREIVKKAKKIPHFL
jgi:hypothetical protein